jgi:hypothetical protein
MYLKPYSTKQEPFNLDRSGMVIVAYGADFNEFVVKDVAENSPAEEAVFRVAMSLSGSRVFRRISLPWTGSIYFYKRSRKGDQGDCIERS